MRQVDTGVKPFASDDDMWTSFVGFMASGKSTLIEVMGQESRLPVYDLDDETARLAECSVPEIFQAGGVAEFRRWERRALSGLTSFRQLLLATGGGCVEQPSNAELLRKHGVVIWLDAPWELLRARIEQAGGIRRPLVGHLGWEGMRRLYLRRRRLYADVAHFRLRTDRAPVPVVARSALLRSLLWQSRRESEKV